MKRVSFFAVLAKNEQAEFAKNRVPARRLAPCGKEEGQRNGVRNFRKEILNGVELVPTRYLLNQKE